MESRKPFGLLFEEKPTDAVQFPDITYDEHQAISFVINQEGMTIPFVESRIVLSTETASSAKRESADLGEEKTYILSSTETVTLEARESTDQDSPMGEHSRVLFLSTETSTKEQNENTYDD